MSRDARMAGGPTVGAARARIRPARNRTRGASNEAKRNLGRHVSALDPLADASHYGRHRPWDIEARALNHCAAHPRGLPVRDARARRTAIRTRHHAARRVVRGWHARHPHEGGTLRRDRQVHRRLLLRLDTLGARRARGLHRHPLGARTVASATGPTEVVHALKTWAWLMGRSTTTLNPRKGAGFHVEQLQTGCSSMFSLARVSCTRGAMVVADCSSA